MRKILIGIVCLGVIFSGVPKNVYAADELSEDQKGAISQSCNTIKQTLKTVQKADSRTRAFLGAKYETFVSDFISPMNIRLTKEGKPNATITSLYSSILGLRQDFVAQFTSYSQDLEELISVDCQGKPEEFYKKLKETRQKRATLKGTVKSIRTNLVNHYTAVKKVEEGLDGGK